MPAGYDAGGDADFGGEAQDVGVGYGPPDALVEAGGNEFLGGAVIGTHLPRIAARAVVDQEILSGVVQHVPRLVEEGEPELVLRLAAQIEQNHHLLRRQPHGRARPRRLGHFRHQRHGHPAGRAAFDQLRHGSLWRVIRQGPDLVERRREPRLVIGLARKLLRLQLAEAQPGRCRTGMRGEA